MLQKYDTFLKKQRNLNSFFNFPAKYFSFSQFLYIFAPAYQGGRHPMSPRPKEMEM